MVKETYCWKNVQIIIYLYLKILVNGAWVGVVNNPQNVLDKFKQYRKGIDTFNNIDWDIRENEIFINTDYGRLCRPIFILIKKTIKIQLVL